MGILRLLLALAVLNSHAKAPLSIFGISMISGDRAVQLFFAISGFYMALVLDSKYASAWLFYLNRFLRLYPTYIITALATIAWWYIVVFYTGKVPPPEWALVAWSEMPLWQRAAVTFSNISMIGLDVLSLLHYQLGQGFTFFIDRPGMIAGPVGNEHWFGSMRWIPQAWSIGAEIWFYLLAPFILRWAIPYQVAALLLSACVFFAMRDTHPLTYFFFPASLWFFLCGALLFRVYSSPWYRFPPEPALIAIGFLIFAAVFYSGHLNGPWLFALLACSAATIPVLFDLTKQSGIDRLIGELSYPVYIVHMLVFSVLWSALRIDSLLAVTVVTLAASGALMLFVETPMDKLRQRLAARGIDRVSA